jgi:arsenate reductase (glutaredoxin)
MTENVVIYHNPRCSKSRLGLSYLREKGVEPEVVLYLENRFTVDTLKQLIEKLSISPAQIIRTTEEIYKMNIKGKSVTNEQLIEWMVNYPQLIERPIVLKKEKAVIARPVEKIDEIL